MIDQNGIAGEEGAPSPDQKGSHGHKSRERRDIASGKVMDPDYMIRIAFGPEGLVVPDFSRKLPGRGAWIAPKREAVEKALKTGAFARAAKAKVNVPADFADLIEAGLKARLIGLLGMARKAGKVETGFDKVKGAAGNGMLAFRFEASDGSEDGRSNIRTSAKSAAFELEEKPAPVVGVFTSAELGKATGRDFLVHLGVRKGRLTPTLRDLLSKLAGFTPLVPAEWPDKEHEPEFLPSWDEKPAIDVANE